MVVSALPDELEPGVVLEVVTSVADASPKLVP
jgi:hypothetical protein